MPISINTRNILSSFSPPSAMTPSAAHQSSSRWRPNRRWLVVLASVCILLVILGAWAPDTVTTHVERIGSRIWGPSESPLALLENGPVVVTMVMVGLASAREGQHMIKSMFMRTSRAIDLHIVCSEDVVPFLRPKLEIVTRPTNNLSVTFYPITESAILERAKRAGVASRHHAGVGGLSKIFLHEILPVKQTLYVDTDAFFVADPALLWAALVDLVRTDSKLLMAFPHNGTATDTNICTCVMAMNLEAMREAPLMPSTLLPAWDSGALGSAAVWKAAEVDPDKPMFGDQSLYFALWQSNKNRFGRLSRSWDISACRLFYRVTLSGVESTLKEEEAAIQSLGDDRGDAEDGILFPGIIHFNCQKGEKSPFDDGALRASPKWGPMLTTVAQYKWVWLNQQQPGKWSPYLTSSTTPSGMHVKVEESVRFLDERIAGAGFDTR